ncbi:MAG: Gfo/Idh/MocA family protein, partial [Alphaproteobacteria bacterium]
MVIGVGVIGVGGMGGRHARNIAGHAGGVSVVALMDLDQVRAGQVAAECGVEATLYSDGLALIADRAVGAVVIASPDKTHAELAKACIAAGKPVLCEKPLATNLAQAKEVMAAEIAHGRRLVQLGFMREYDPQHLALNKILRGRGLGRPLMFSGLHTNLREGDGGSSQAEVVINSAVHDIHSARWLMGDDIVRVMAQSVPFGPDKPESCRLLHLQLWFKNGAMGSILVNADSGYGYEVAVEITGETGMARTQSLGSPVVRGGGQAGHAGQAGQAVEPDWLVRFE